MCREDLNGKSGDICRGRHTVLMAADLKKSSDSRLQLLSSFRGGMLDDVVTCCPTGQPYTSVICACVAVNCDLHSIMLDHDMKIRHDVTMYLKFGVCQADL